MGADDGGQATAQHPDAEQARADQQRGAGTSVDSVPVMATGGVKGRERDAADGRVVARAIHPPAP